MVDVRRDVRAPRVFHILRLLSLLSASDRRELIRHILVMWRVR